mgnify:CR=1 FL=1
MANLAKKELDTRTFPQICASITNGEWLAIRDRIMEKTEKTRQAVYKWKEGECIPASIQERRVVAEVVNSILKIRTSYKTLFAL